MVMANPVASVYPHKLRRLYWPFLGLAEECRHIIGTVAGSFSVDGNRYTIPRFTFLGPVTNVPQRRVGVFALIHGDEPAGATALLQLLRALADHPELAAGYDVACYPVCNPTGFEDGTRQNRAGFDLNRQFWIGSNQPEIRILEEELRTGQFDGIVALHADDDSEGLYGYAHGRELNEDLLLPALRASERIVPCNLDAIIDGFAARAGVIDDCFHGVLRPPPEQHPQPFEVIFETPGRAEISLQANAAEIAVRTMLQEYRRFISFAQDI
jgi:protein MpaA